MEAADIFPLFSGEIATYTKYLYLGKIPVGKCTAFAQQYPTPLTFLLSKSAAFDRHKSDQL